MSDNNPGPGGFGESLTPPQALDAERSVLAAMLLDSGVVGRAIELIEPEAFYRTAHQKIFEAICALYDRRETPDLVTLAEELRRRGELEAVGGAPALAQLTEYATTSANLEHHIRIVASKRLLRQLIKASGEIQQEAYAGSDDTATILDRAEQRVFAISDQRVRAGFTYVRDLLTPAFEHIQKMFERQALVTGVPTGFERMDELTAGFQNSDLVILAGRPAMGKCLTGRTLIDDPATGERRSIEEAVRCRQRTVLGVTESGRVRETRVGGWMDSGVKPCFRLTTRLGRSVEATARHPFLTIEGWKPLAKLTPGDRVAVPSVVPACGTDTSWSLERVRLLAYFIAEGNLTSRCPRFTNGDPVLVRDFQRCLLAEFPTCEANNEGDGLAFRVARAPEHRRPWNAAGSVPNPVTRWLEDLGLMGKLSTRKSLPPAVWRWDRTRLAEFIRALFSCDATIYPMAGYPRIEYTVASEPLARETLHALCRLGIVAKFWQKTANSWRVEITDPEAVAHYQSVVGWLGEKEKRFPSNTRLGPWRHGNRGHAPREVWPLVRAAARRHGLTLSELARRAGERVPDGFNAHAGRGIPRPRLAAMAAVLADPQLEVAGSADLYWDEIVSIEPIGRHRVYDLTVPDGANFIADDVVVHNSAMALNLAENASIPSRRDLEPVPVAVFSLEMSKEQLAQRLLCSQGGVDLHRVRSGRLTTDDWPKLTTAAGMLKDAPIMIDDSPAPTLMEIRAKCRRLRSEDRLGLLIIDYLQLIRSSGQAENRVQEISQITRGLKSLAKELNIPIIALSQLSRAAETRDKSGRPQLSDLRESGCLTADTRIARADTGALVTLGELLEGGERDIPVWTLDRDLRLVRGTMTHVFPSGVKPVFEMRLASGRRVKASANHPFLTLDGWRPLERLAPGTRLAVPRTLPEPERSTAWPEAEVVMLGHMLGDGCFATRQPVHYTSADPANLEAVESAAGHFGITPRRVGQGSWSHVYLPAPYRLTHGRRNPLQHWLARFGLSGLRSYEKFIPREVFALPIEQIRLFLRHLWATDGCVHLGKGRQARIYYASTSRALIDDLQALLLRLGVNGRIKATIKGDYKPSWQLHIYGAENQLRFLEDVGVHGARGEQVAPIIRHLRSLTANPNVDTVPVEVWTSVKGRMAERGVTARAFAAGMGTAYCGSTLYKHAPSRERLGAVAALLDDPELDRLAHSDVFWDTILSVTPLGERPVFDATVPGTHNFVADGIVAHNSIEQDADLVMFVYREEVYNKEAEKGKAEIIIAKQRNGPTGVVTLTFLRESTKFVPYFQAMPGETEVPEF